MHARAAAKLAQSHENPEAFVAAAFGAAAALAIYFLAISPKPLVGAFPVPLAGMGMSPILGFWLGIGVLSATTQPRMLP